MQHCARVRGVVEDVERLTRLTRCEAPRSAVKRAPCLLPKYLSIRWAALIINPRLNLVAVPGNLSGRQMKLQECSSTDYCGFSYLHSIEVNGSQGGSRLWAVFGIAVHTGCFVVSSSGHIRQTIRFEPTAAAANARGGSTLVIAVHTSSSYAHREVRQPHLRGLVSGPHRGGRHLAGNALSLGWSAMAVLCPLRATVLE